LRITFIGVDLNNIYVYLQTVKQSGRWPAIWPTRDNNLRWRTIQETLF